MTSAQVIEMELQAVLAKAQLLGVSVRVDRVPLMPLAMGNMRHVVHCWEARNASAFPLSMRSNMNFKDHQLALLSDFIEHVTHWQEGRPDRHDALIALRTLAAKEQS